MLDLEPIKARLAAWVPGGWRIVRRSNGRTSMYTAGAVFVEVRSGLKMEFADAAQVRAAVAFIVTAHADLAALMAEVERLRAVAEAAKAETAAEDAHQRAGAPEDEAGDGGPLHRLYLARLARLARRAAVRALEEVEG